MKTLKKENVIYVNYINSYIFFKIQCFSKLPPDDDGDYEDDSNNKIKQLVYIVYDAVTVKRIDPSPLETKILT